MAIATETALATDYTTILTPENGFTEVTSTDGILIDEQYCYLLTAAETNNLYVGVGKYEEKPNWAGEDTKVITMWTTPQNTCCKECSMG